MKNISNTPDCYIDYLLNSPLFSGLTAEEIEGFLNNSRHEFIHLNAHSELPVKSDKSIFILSGALATYEINESGEKTFISLFPAETNPIIPISKNYSYPNMAIFAKKESVVLFLETESYTTEKPALLLYQNRIQQNIINLLYDGIVFVMSRALCNTEPQARDRILKYIGSKYQSEKQLSLSIAITKDELADHLQMDTSTLMRELKKLKSEGIIDYDRKNIIIKDEELFID